MAKIKTVILDFDGTIADTFGVVKQILKAELPKQGISNFSNEDWEDYCNGEAKKVLLKVGLGPIRLWWLIRKMQYMLNEKLTEVKVFKGMKGVIDRCKERGLVIGLVSSDIKENVEAVLKREKIEVKRVIAGGTFFGKDRLIKKYLNLERLLPEEVVYVGDEVRDIEACRRVGVKKVAVTWGYNSKKALIKASPDWIVDKPVELIGIVDSYGEVH